MLLLSSFSRHDETLKYIQVVVALCQRRALSRVSITAKFLHPHRQIAAGIGTIPG
jgi:hypothetical protein